MFWTFLIGLIVVAVIVSVAGKGTDTTPQDNQHTYFDDLTDEEVEYDYLQREEEKQEEEDYYLQQRQDD